MSATETETEAEPREGTEDYHAQAEAAVRVFSYRKPDMTEVPRAARANLGRTDIVRGVVQVWKKGGENNLHYHAHTDSVWFVLKGKVRFYGPGDKLIGEFGPHEGVIMPRGARYWFENLEDDDLEILQVVSYAEKNGKDTGRTDVAPLKFPIGESVKVEAVKG